MVVDEGLEGEAGNGLRTRFQGSNVDDAVEGGTSVEGTCGALDHFNMRDGFHRNQRPGGLCRVGRQEGEAVEQHLNAGAHAVAPSGTAADVGLTVLDGDPGRLDEGVFYLEQRLVFQDGSGQGVDAGGGGFKALRVAAGTDHGGLQADGVGQTAFAGRGLVRQTLRSQGPAQQQECGKERGAQNIPTKGGR